MHDANALSALLQAEQVSRYRHIQIYIDIDIDM